MLSLPAVSLVAEERTLKGSYIGSGVPSRDIPRFLGLYKRGKLRLQSADAACRQFAAADQAQEAFLAAGGPERDGKALDPDGDGFACAWDPRPFRNAQ